jgi:hypothetical protein
MKSLTMSVEISPGGFLVALGASLLFPEGTDRAAPVVISTSCNDHPPANGLIVTYRNRAGKLATNNLLQPNR